MAENKVIGGQQSDDIKRIKSGIVNLEDKHLDLESKIDNVKNDTKEVSSIKEGLAALEIKQLSFEEKLDLLEEDLVQMGVILQGQQTEFDDVFAKIESVDESKPEEQVEESVTEDALVNENTTEVTDEDEESVEEDEEFKEDITETLNDTEDKVDEVLENLEDRVKFEQDNEVQEEQATLIQRSLDANLSEAKKGNKSIADRLDGLLKSAKDNKDNLMLIVIGALTLVRLLQKGFDAIKDDVTRVIKPILDLLKPITTFLGELWDKLFPTDKSAELARDEADYVKHRMPNQYTDEEVQQAIDDYKEAYDAYNENKSEENLINLSTAASNLNRYTSQEANPMQFAEDYESLVGDYRGSDPRYQDTEHYNPNRLQLNRSLSMAELQKEMETRIIKQKQIIKDGLAGVGSLQDLGIDDSMLHYDASGAIDIYDAYSDNGPSDDEVKQQQLEDLNSVRTYFDSHTSGYMSPGFHGVHTRKESDTDVRVNSVDDYLKELYEGTENIPDYLNSNSSSVTPVSEQPDVPSVGGEVAMVQTNNNNVNNTTIVVNRSDTYLPYT